MSEITVGIIQEVYKDDKNRPRCSVMDESGSFYRSCAFAGQSGGSKENYSHTAPAQSASINKIDDDVYDGAIVLLLHVGADIPFIIGTLPSPLLETVDNSIFVPDDTRSFDADTYHNVDKAHLEDDFRKLNGSVRNMGAEGITLDTLENGKNIRLQVASDSHVRISQKGSDTTDHVLLASHMMTKLTQLETALATIASAVNGINAAVSGIQTSLALITGGGMQGGAPVPLSSANPFVFQPEGLPANVPVSPWAKGEEGSYKADCLRISKKSTG